MIVSVAINIEAYGSKKFEMAPLLEISFELLQTFPAFSCE